MYGKRHFVEMLHYGPITFMEPLLYGIDDVFIIHTDRRFVNCEFIKNGNEGKIILFSG